MQVTPISSLFSSAINHLDVFSASRPVVENLVGDSCLFDWIKLHLPHDAQSTQTEIFGKLDSNVPNETADGFTANISQGGGAPIYLNLEGTAPLRESRSQQF